MNEQTLVAVALRVLSCWNHGTAPAPQDVEILRQHASAGDADLEIDALACAIVRRETAKVLAESREARKPLNPGLSEDKRHIA